MKRRLLDFFRLIWKIELLEDILVKFTIGKTFGEFITKLPPNHYQYKKGTIRKVERDGINYKLDLSDLIDWYIYFGFKEVSREKLYSLIKKDFTIIDVGANVGDVTLHMSKYTKNNGLVYSFEPDSVNFKRLQRNITLNSFSNIIINKKGLGNEKGGFKIYTVDENNKGMNRILKESKGNKNFNVINVTTLDLYVTEKEIQNIDMIKIDVEGFEMNVLYGGSKTLDKYHPILFIELDNQNLIDQGSSAKDLVIFLEEKGYKLLNAETNEKITSKLDFSYCHFDVIAKYIDNRKHNIKK